MQLCNGEYFQQGRIRSAEGNKTYLLCSTEGQFDLIQARESEKKIPKSLQCVPVSLSLSETIDVCRSAGHLGVMLGFGGAVCVCVAAKRVVQQRTSLLCLSVRLNPQRNPTGCAPANEKPFFFFSYSAKTVIKFLSTPSMGINAAARLACALLNGIWRSQNIKSAFPVVAGGVNHWK